MTSNIGTWYFWFNIACFILPLIILIIVIDRKRIFEICFYGYFVHILASRVDSFLESNNYLVHPHSLTYLLPSDVTVTSVVLPVSFIFIYQYCTNQKKNFYFHALLLSLVISYGLDSMFLAVACLAFWLTNLFRLLKNRGI